MKTFTLKIVTPENLLLEKVVTSVTLPLIDGEATILADHEAYIGICKPGGVTMKDEKGVEQVFATSGGFMEFHGNTLVVLADTAEPAENIDVERAEAAKKLAEELMQKTDFQDQEAYERTAALLQKEIARIHIGRKHHASKGRVSLSSE
jgi:F-type H+-transporting ATPase subunit epsilon